MATNEVFKFGQWVSLPVTEGTESGSPVVVGGLVGVAQTAEGEGGNAAGYASVALEGAFRCPVGEAVASVGAPIYIASDYSLTTTASTNSLFGHALTTSASGGDEVVIRLAGHNTGAEA